MKRLTRLLQVFLLALVACGLAAPSWAAGFPIARIYIEYNRIPNDLGFHVFLDAEDWKSVKIFNPAGTCIFSVQGKAGYQQLGLTELFFEGAEPQLDEFPLADLLALFPEGTYKFVGVTVDGRQLSSNVPLSHAVPDGPAVSALVDDDEVVISWTPVSQPPAGFPRKTIRIVGYQVIVGSFQVTLPASATQVTVPEEFVETLGRGEHDFEVLAIDASGNQTITEGTFEID